MIQILDEVYGEEEIYEKVLIDLINCDAVQRLKTVSQVGMPKEYYHKKFDYNRYEHSIGVFILLRKLGATIEEQIAGLLHDISHTAFSHVVDWILGDPSKEDYQDNIFFEYLNKSTIPLILDNAKIDKNIFLNLEDFPLLEKEAPSLCADRFDYAIRELFKEGKKDLVKEIFLDLDVENNQIVFKNKKIAEIFSREYMRLQKEHWAGDQARARYFLLSEILKRAIDIGLISIEDFYLPEKDILDSLSKSDDEFILNNLNLLRNGFSVQESSEGVEIKKKFRYIDPEVFSNGDIFPLSSLSSTYKSYLEEYKKFPNLIKQIKIISRR